MIQRRLHRIIIFSGTVAVSFLLLFNVYGGNLGDSDSNPTSKTSQYKQAFAKPDKPETPGKPDDTPGKNKGLHKGPPPSSDTDTSKRDPPSILGIGIYRIIPTDGKTELDPKFEGHFPYGNAITKIDKSNYGSIKKAGVFFELYSSSTETDPIIVRPNDIVQLQVLLSDQFQSSQIKGLKLHIEEHDAITKGDHDDVHITWKKFDTPQIDDPEHHFDDVKVNHFIEDGNLWVIFDLKVNKPIHDHQPNIHLETWHESGRKRFVEVLDIYNVVSIPDIRPADEIITHVDSVIVPIEHSNPSCADFDICNEPSRAMVLEGGIVTWISQDPTFFHTITSGNPEKGPDRRFNLVLRPGETVSNQFSIPGSYQYYCMIHPWATGVVDVFPQLKTEEGKIISPRDPNVSGKVDIPEVTRYPITVHSLEGGNSRLVEQNDVVYLKNKDMRFVVSGHVENQSPRPVTINIQRPDGSESKMSTVVNHKGNYFVPVVLSTQWMKGHYDIKSFYNGDKIGNISFKITGAKPTDSGSQTQVPPAPPLEQMKSGKDISEIRCKPGWVLVEKQNDGKPACVKEVSLEKLFLRGWAKIPG